MRRPAALALVLALGLAGCGDGDVAPGGELTVYVSLPLRGPNGGDGRDAARGAKLALAEAGERAGELPVRAVYMDDTSGSGARARWDAARVAANARRATGDSTAIAYVGDFESGATRTSLPITNAARVLQVSPASSAVDLVSPFPGSDELPEDIQTAGERSFGRVIPDDEAQAAAAAAWARRLGVRRFIPISDDTEFGDVMATEFQEEAERLGLEVGRARTELLYFGGDPYVVAGRRGPAEPVPPRGPPVMSSDFLLDPERREDGLLVTSAAQDPSQLPPSGQEFLREFEKRYGADPGRYAAYGYEAMAVVLDSIERAGGSGKDREAVIDAFLETEGRDSILGAYSIDEVGNTTLGRMAGYRIVGGQPRFEDELGVP